MHIAVVCYVSLCLELEEGHGNLNYRLIQTPLKRWRFKTSRAVPGRAFITYSLSLPTNRQLCYQNNSRTKLLRERL